MKKNKIIGYIFFIFLLIININIKAEKFGESCPGVIFSTTNEINLKKDTIYGYIKKQFLIEKRYCDSKDSSITICVRDNQDSDSCTNVTLNLEDTVYLGDLNKKNSILSNNNILRNVPLLTLEIDNKICLSMPTIYGTNPLICRNSNKERGSDEKKNIYASNLNISPACYENPKHSLVPSLSLSGRAIQCTKDTLDVSFLGKTPEGKKVALGKINNFFKFQSWLSKSVGAFLVIYLIFFGIRILLNPYELTLNVIAMAAIKVILVWYFAIGVNGDFFGIETKNGMTDIVMPLSMQAIWGFADMALSGVSSQLCAFNPSDYKEGYKYYALWDFIDCRIGHYLGLNDTLGIKEITESLKEVWRVGLKWFSIQIYLLLGGNIIMVLFNIIFCIFLIWMTLKLITHLILCLLSIYVLVYFSPIFVPMCLFSRTNGYFTGWRNSLLSCTLQPTITIGFILLALLMFDTAIYKDCKFKRSLLKQDGDYKYYEFEMNPTSETCKSSVGYYWYSIYKGEHWKSRRVILFSVPYIEAPPEFQFEVIYLFFFCSIFYYFSKISTEMAEELANGPNVGNIVDTVGNFVIESSKGVANKINEIAIKTAVRAVITTGKIAMKIPVYVRNPGELVKDVSKIPVKTAKEAIKTTKTIAKKIVKTAVKTNIKIAGTAIETADKEDGKHFEEIVKTAEKIAKKAVKTDEKKNSK